MDQADQERRRCSAPDAIPPGLSRPPLGVAVIAAFIPYYWFPIAGEIAKAQSRRDRENRT
ncbi:hypothetical protein ACWEWX_01945 [Streptomyces asiaticus]|uniref:hypothetical protein n=1 Tax=Streptomyces asiaticus TaxID=114695 RepID=UPI003D73C548